MLTTVWEWLKKAPLPVVLALILPIGSWVFYTQDALHAEQVEQKAQIAAAEKINKERDKDLQERVDKANEKLDKLLEALLAVKASLEEHQKATEKKGSK